MNNPLFSILIAQYNNGKYLAEAIESIKSQTYEHWEIIIVDDCSTDNSAEIYRNYADDNRIKIYYNDENKGCGYTKRRCAELTNGELCGFLDPDDTLTNDALEIMAKIHSCRKDIVGVASRSCFCDENMKRMWESEIKNKDENLQYLTDRKLSIEQFFAFKTKFYRDTKGISADIKRAVDRDLYYKLEEKGKIMFIDNTLYNYRLHDGGISQLDYKARYWHILVIKDACERRGLNTEDVVNKWFLKDAEIAEKRYSEIINSSYYRWGKFLLFPFHRIRRKLKKIFLIFK